MAHPRFDFNFEDSVPSGGPLGPEELAAQEVAIDPANIIADHQERQAKAAERVQALKMQRLQEENARLLQESTQAHEQARMAAEDQAYLRGKVEAMATQSPAIDPDLQFDEEELATHGHAKGFVTKVAKLETKNAVEQAKQEITQAYNQQLADLEQKYAAQLQAQKQELNNIHGTIKSNFESEVRDAVDKMGLDYGALLAGDDAFMAYAARPLAVGSPMMWGTQLEQNIENQDLTSTVAMFQQYAASLRQSANAQGVDVDSQELPSSTGARPLSPQAQSSLQKRQQLMQEAERIQDQFLQGTYPGTHEEYQIEKAKLLNQADEIPLPV